jgi:uncharacterized protein (TIGR02594 family)
MQSNIPPQLAAMQAITGTSWAPGDGANSDIAAWLKFIAMNYPATSSYCRSVIHEDYFEWCGLAVGYCIAKSGIQPVFGAQDTDRFLWALAWQEWGDMVQTPSPGDVVVFDFGGGHHHVTLFESDNGNGYWACRGGNQSNQVKTSNFPKSRVHSIQRPGVMTSLVMAAASPAAARTISPQADLAMAPTPATPAPQPGTLSRFGSLVPGGFFSSDPFNHSVPRSIRTNNAGALNISSWQRTRPGFVGVTESDGSSNQNVTTIYRTPEHGVGSWFHLIKDIYGFGDAGNFRIDELAKRYAGSAAGPEVTAYVNGWSHSSHGKIVAATVISLASDEDMLTLAKAMFGFEAGIVTPLHDDQITFATAHERAGTLPA